MTADPSLSEHPVAVPSNVARTHLRRRPSGAAPPLPRRLGKTGKGWIIALIVSLAWILAAYVSRNVRRTTDQMDAFVLRALADHRDAWLTNVFRAVDRAATGWILTTIAIVLLVSTVALRRWRHLFTFLGSVLVLQVSGVIVIAAFDRPRPYDVTTIGRWQGYSLPSATLAVVSITVIGIAYMLVVAGRSRTIAKWVGGVLVGLVAAARLYLGIDHPFDVLTGVIWGVAIPLNAFRFFTPNEVFPVTYRGGKTAHLDVGGRRGEAIRRAVEDQLGVTIVDISPIGLAGSGGSTPLRLRVAGNPDTFMFGKLYAMNHVRADRWYKLGRTIFYGRLEDERPFQSVRRLAQYEDYALRVIRDAGVPTAAPLGVVELTPEREYLLVTELFDGAVEIGEPEVEVDDEIIDEGLAVVRRLWRAGLAHRDIKPANLLVRDGHLFVIDVAFAQIRPSPWREAVDLANMMLVLAVRTSAERVYERAVLQFSPDEIAEAFAAARGIASPTQLRTVMKQDGRDLLAQFRAMAPPRRPISLQTWGPRRIVLGVGVLAILAFTMINVYFMFTPAELPVTDQPACGTDNVMILIAQSVPSAGSVPCVESLPAGWDVGQVDVRRGRTRFSLHSEREGKNAVEVELLPPERCDVDDAVEVSSDELGLRRFEQVEQLPPDLRAIRTYVAEGTCVVYRFHFDGDANAAALAALDSALRFQPRQLLIDEVDRRTDGLVLCGAGAPPCAGDEQFP